MADRQPWRCEGCHTILGWITPSRRLQLCGLVKATIGSGDVACYVCGEVRRFYPADGQYQQLLSRIAEFRDWLNSSELG